MMQYARDSTVISFMRSSLPSSKRTSGSGSRSSSARDSPRRSLGTSPSDVGGGAPMMRPLLAAPHQPLPLQPQPQQQPSFVGLDDDDDVRLKKGQAEEYMQWLLTAQHPRPGSDGEVRLSKEQAQEYFESYSLPWDDLVWELASGSAGAEQQKLSRLGAAVKELGHRGHSFPHAAQKPQCPFLARMRVPEPARVLVVDGKQTAGKSSIEIFQSIGGRDRLRALTGRFYPKMFRDRQLSLFIEDFTEPHPDRLADWLAQKMSGDERHWNAKLHLRGPHEPADRSAAHSKAWHSRKRSARDRGERFKLDDAVAWMRLMFWSCREEGLDTEPFFSWFLGFIKHFINVYTSRAPPYTAFAAKWSLDPNNIAKYEADGWLMTDISGKGRDGDPRAFGFFQ